MNPAAAERLLYAAGNRVQCKTRDGPSRPAEIVELRAVPDKHGRARRVPEHE
jgi:hypothetical protein